MIKIQLVTSRVPTKGDNFSQHFQEADVWIAPEGVETVTPLDGLDLKKGELPSNIRCVVRYWDRLTGYRLMFCKDRAEDIATMRARAMRGEGTNPDDPFNMGDN